MTTIAAAVAARIIDANLVGPQVWRRRPVDEVPRPYVTYIDPISLVPSLHGDGRTLARRRLLQWDLWEDEEDDDPVDGRFDALVALLDGLRIVANRHTFRCRVTQAVDVPDDAVIHHSITLMVDHVA